MNLSFHNKNSNFIWLVMVTLSKVLLNSCNVYYEQYWLLKSDSDGHCTMSVVFHRMLYFESVIGEITHCCFQSVIHVHMVNVCGLFIVVCSWLCSTLMLIKYMYVLHSFRVFFKFSHQDITVWLLHGCHCDNSLHQGRPCDHHRVVQWPLRNNHMPTAWLTLWLPLHGPFDYH